MPAELKFLMIKSDEWVFCERDSGEYYIKGPYEFADLQLSMFAVLMYLRVCSLRFGGLEVACWPLVPKFAGSNPAQAVEILRAKKSSARLPSEGK
jgi:hypothetical protein